MAQSKVSKFFFGNTAMMPKQKFEHFSMLAALVSIGYVGFVAIKEMRRGRKH
jgi:hypothetical protein